MFSILFFLILPIVVILGLVLILRNSTKPWMNVFYSNNDLLRELFTICTLIIFNTLAWKVFFIIARDYESNSTAALELMFLGTFLASLAFSIFVRSYISTTISILANFFFLVGEIIHWSVDDYFLRGNGAISPLIIISLSWLLLNLLYVLAKYLYHIKAYARVGGLLRASIIFINIFVLGFLSSTAVVRNTSFIEGQTVMASIPVVLVGLFSLAAFGACMHLVKVKKIELNMLEFLFTTLPMLIMFFLGNTILRSPTSTYTYGRSLNSFDIAWLATFNLLFFLYLIQLVVKGGQNKELWLKVYSIILLVLGVIYKFFDLFSGFALRGAFFVIIGLLSIVAVYLVDRSNNKKTN